jgi:UDP-4-amino-4,6-dideoxy-N-acetyl-beta-L-altrosamine transaminase
MVQDWSRFGNVHPAILHADFTCGKRNMIPYGRQSISEADIEAVVEVLRSDFLTQGPAVPRFEAALRGATGAPFAIAMNSATSALHAGCLALGVGSGSRVWTTPISFVASANCALYCGAAIDFVDIDAASFNLCPHALEQKLERAEQTGTLPDLVIPVHLTGQVCEMGAIHALSARFGFKVMEDASHAIGALYDGAPVGSLPGTDITVFSFHPVKIITTGEGGAATTADPILARKLERLRSHGITREADEMTHGPDGSWYYQQIELGFNYRMTDLQAALGASQMQRLKVFVARRNALADRYDALIAASGLPLRAPHQIAASHSARHLYVVQLEGAAADQHHQVFDALKARGIGVNLHYIPIHTQPYYRALGFTAGDFPVAEDYYRRSISLPLFPDMTEADQDRVMDALHMALMRMAA